MLGHRLHVAPQALETPFAGALGIGHGLESGEGLGRDEEKRLRRIQVAHGLREVGTVDVGDEAEGHGPLAVEAERLVGHHRPEVGAADADVDHVADALPRVPLPGAAPHALGELAHLVEDLVHLGDHVHPVHLDRCGAGGAQGHVEHGAVLRHVDLLAPEHGVDAGAQAGLLGELEEERQGLVGDTMF